MKLKFRTIRWVVLRLKKKISNFYEDVSIEKKKVITQPKEKKKTKHIRRLAKKAIANWMYDLKQTEAIKIRKFKYLFSELNEVVFPIKIVDVCIIGEDGFDIDIIDNEGKRYYMSKRGFYFDGQATYNIGRRNSSIEPLINREFRYKICNDKRIVLIETSTMKLGIDGIVNIFYNYEKGTKEAKLLTKSIRIIQIEYKAMGEEIDRKVQDYIFSINKETLYYYNAFPILKWLLSIISDEEVTLSIETKDISKDGIVIGSEIEVKDGIVQKYTQTKINEGEIQIIQNIFKKDLKQFMEENS